MKIDKYKELLDKILHYYPNSCLAQNIKKSCLNVPAEYNPPVDEKNNVIVNYLISDNSGTDNLPDILFEMFPICGCGEPERALKQYYLALKHCNSTRDPFETAFSSSPWTDNLDLYYVVMYQLNGLGMTEHGTSINFSWLTDKGLAAYDLLSEIIKE